MSKIIAKINVDYDDNMVVYNLVKELNDQLKEYHLSIEVEDEEHDGYDVVILPTMGFSKMEFQGEEYWLGPENQILGKITKN